MELSSSTLLLMMNCWVPIGIIVLWSFWPHWHLNSSVNLASRSHSSSLTFSGYLLGISWRDSKFQPSFNQVADSWRRKSSQVKDGHFFAQLDFADGQAVYQRVSYQSTVLWMSWWLARSDIRSYRSISPRSDRPQQVQQALSGILWSKQAVSL